MNICGGLEARRGRALENFSGSICSLIWFMDRESLCCQLCAVYDNRSVVVSMYLNIRSVVALIPMFFAIFQLTMILVFGDE